MADTANVNQPAASERIALSELQTDLLDSMTWLDAALAPEWTRAELEAAVSAGNGVLVTDTEGSAIGVAVVLRDLPEPGAATVAFLAIAPERRFRGLGGEAGLALDAALRADGFTGVYATVPDGRGLAVYFWLRLGFRPLTTLDSPGALMGLSDQPVRGIWMLRDAL